MAPIRRYYDDASFLCGIGYFGIHICFAEIVNKSNVLMIKLRVKEKQQTKFFDNKIYEPFGNTANCFVFSRQCHLREELHVNYKSNFCWILRRFVV